MVTPIDRGAPLVQRELDVLAYIADGQTNASIGQRMHLSEDTVKTYVRRSFRKLGARDRAHAVVIALHRGLLVDDGAGDTPHVRVPDDRSRADHVADWRAMTPRQRAERYDQLAAATPNGA